MNKKMEIATFKIQPPLRNRNSIFFKFAIGKGRKNQLTIMFNKSINVKAYSFLVNVNQ